MAKHRSNGEGSIYKRKDGGWFGVITVGIDPETGKQDRRYIYGKTRQKVAQKMNETLHKVNTGTYIEPTRITVKEWLEEWLKGRKPHLADNSWRTYDIMIRCHIIPAIGRIKLKDLKTRDIQNLINEKMENGRVEGEGGLSPRTVKYIYSTLHTALKQAVRERIIPFNVAEAVELPKKRKKEMNTLSAEESRRFLQTTRKSPLHAAYLLALSTGLRQGEILGLKWEDIDFDEGALTVKRQLLRTTDQGLVLEEPKTKHSRRTISLNKEVIKELKLHKKEQNEVKLKAGPGSQDNDLLFFTDEGKPIDPRNFFRRFKRLLKEAGIPDIPLHNLRHTYATLSLEAGIDPKTIQEILGHSTISTTMDTYSHVTIKMQKDAADTIGNLLKI